jgi:alcohol dehydrogenase
MRSLGYNVRRGGERHAVAHACGGRYGTPHGVANAILLTHGMEFSLREAADRYRDVAEAVELVERAY